jgi:hypothetical protein
VVYDRIGETNVEEKPMARRPYRDALSDQPLECRLIPFTGDEVRDRPEGLSAGQRWLYLPVRQREEDLQQDLLLALEEDSDDFYQ